MSDYSDQEDPDDFVFFGHSLDPLEEDEVPSKKPIRIEDQIVTDENGRRRFHGAFTGGFSAGYYNTVGSKEGWRPSTFKSSRSERAQIKHSVQDYMDEEDMGAFGFAPQVLRAKDDFGTTSTSRKRARPVYPSEGPIPGLPVLHDLLRPVKESIGLRLLKAMGWKPGQGVGERITRKEKKQRKKRNDPSRVYGCPLPPKKQAASDESEEESEDEVHLFAPDDIPSFLVKPKENTFGLGYSGLVPRDAAAGKSSGFSLFEPTLSITDKNRKVRIAGQAFGVGAFEDDDEDIYSRDDMSQYDFILGGEKPKEKLGKKMLALPSTDTLDGFVKAAKPEPVPKIFPPPNLPRDFVPVHRTRKSRFDVQPAEESALRGLGRHQLDSAQRAAILGDIKPSPAAPRAVVPATPLPQTVSVPKPTERPAPRPEPQQKESPRLSSNDPEWKKKREEILKFLATQKPSDQSVLFQPFVQDSQKQKRFESYMILSKASKTDDFRYLQPESMTEWEREREENEFERAFALYRPLSGQMQNRFASGGHFEESIQGGLGTFVPPTETESKVKSVETEKDPARRAAKMKMFGKLTRQKIEWRPDRLLCVRFNVPNPFPSSGAQPSKPVPKRGPREFSIFDVLSKEPEEPAVSKISDLDASQTKNVAEVKSLEWEKAEKGETVDQAEPEKVAGPLEEHKNAEEEDIAVQRPPMDFFKAIFESEDEEESTEEQRDEEKKNAEQREEEKPATAVSVSETSDSSEEEEDGRDSDSFGPRLPVGKPVVLSSGSVTNVHIQRNFTNDDAEWVEKREDGEKKKKKKKEKKEHKKSKNKKKHREDREKSKKHKHRSKSPDLDSKLAKKLAKLSKSK